MSARAQWGIVAVVILLLGGGLWMATHVLGDELFPVRVGSKAPEFTAATLEAEPVARTLADYRGKVVLLNIWATWCGPCRVEMPSMQALHESFRGRGLHIVAVSIDGAGQEEAVRAFTKEYALTFEILHDPSGSIRRVYQTTGVPESFLIGTDGVIVKKVIGAVDWNSAIMRKTVQGLLGPGLIAGVKISSGVRQ